MAAVEFAELLGQVRERLGLHQKTVVKLGKAVGALELSDTEVQQVEDAVNIELARIYAERHLADTLYRIPHDEVTTPDVDEVGQPVLDPRTGNQTVTRRNQRDSCPDCGRVLIAAREQDAETALLVCSRLAGLKVSLADLTPHDIVACGVTG